MAVVDNISDEPIRYKKVKGYFKFVEDLESIHLNLVDTLSNSEIRK